MSRGSRVLRIFAPFLIDFAVSIAVGTAASTLFGMKDEVAITLLVDVCLILALMIPFLLDCGKRGGGLKISAVSLALSAFLGAAAAIFLNLVIMLTPLPVLDHGFREMAEAVAGAPTGLSLLAVVIVGPLSEELLYRGLFYRRLEEILPKAAAAVISAAVFGAFHGNVVQFVYAFAIGILLAAIYELTGSFAAAVIMHAAANLIVCVCDLYGLWEFFLGNTAILAAILTICGGVTCGLLYVQFRMDKKTERAL